MGLPQKKALPETRAWLAKQPRVARTLLQGWGGWKMGRAGAAANAKAKDVAEGQSAGAGMPVTRAGSGMTGTMQAGSVSDGAACMWQIAPGAIVIAH